jgi:hypothetical protein
LFGGVNSLIFNGTYYAKQNQQWAPAVAAGDFLVNCWVYLDVATGIPTLFGNKNKKVFVLYPKPFYICTNKSNKNMGQYFKPIILGEQPQEGQHETVVAWMYSHKYDNGLKLMEHSYQGNNFVSTFEKELTRRGSHYKSRVVWGGDYADEEPGVKVISEGKEYDANLYSLCNDGNEISPKVTSTDDYPYIVNHTKKLFVDKNNVPEIVGWEGTKIHPLPLLTSEGNGQGGGDFRGKDENEIVGSWARDVISVEKDSPKLTTGTMDYTELIFDLKE